MLTIPDPSPSPKRNPLQDYTILHNKLHSFIQQVNQKIVSRIQLVQQVYLDDYKQQVALMAAQLKSIRGVLDQEVLKQRSNERMFYLEEERDFFRAQVVKLNEELKRIKEENVRVKGELADTKDQCQNFRKLVYELESRIYKLTYQNVQIEKMREDKKTTLETGTHATPSKGFQTERGKGTYRSSKAKDENDVDNETHPLLKTKKNTQYSLRKLKPSLSLASYTPNGMPKQPSSRQQILDSCIKQLKKQIYYRNLNPKQSAKVHFNQESEVIFEKFTKSDKKQLVMKFMSNPQILDELYRLVFMREGHDGREGRNQMGDEFGGSLTKIAMAKGMDSRYNTRMLASFKTEFDKRIYDIKNNRQ